MKRSLVICTHRSSFVEGDIEILQKWSEVTVRFFVPQKSILILWELFKQFLFLLFHLRKFDIVYVWFGDYHSFLPILMAKWLGKRSYLVVGGYDVARMKAFKYGSFINPVRGFMTRLSMKYCTLNLCVSKYVERKVRWICPKAKTKVVYNSINSIFHTGNDTNKENIILTVSSVTSKQTFYIKGIDRILTLAKEMPAYQFVIIGIDPYLQQELIQEKTKNVTIFHRLTQEELIQYYQKAKIYCQLSRMDTFCLTLAEAMFYECYPIITNVGGMPEVVGNYGFILETNTTPKQLVQIIESVMQSDTNIQCKERIEKYFMFEKRREQLFYII